MIEVTVGLQHGCLTSLRVTGHAPAIGSDGVSVVCAAASSLVRATAEVLVAHDTSTGGRLGVTGEAPQAGALEIAVATASADAEWLRGVTDTLLVGVRRIAAEAPTEVRVEVVKGEQHGS